MPYDAVLLVSFGGPECAEDVVPFLENVLRGRSVPRERMLEVAEHYYHFNGRSPINDQCRALLAAIREQLSLPVYWGNRNWHPMLPETVQQMAADGVKHAIAIATSAYSSYSSCRQYIENIAAARGAVGEGAPVIDKLPPFWHHAGFVEANADRVSEALAKLPQERHANARLIFTAHSIPVSMASQCRYEEQLVETAKRVSARVGHGEWDLVWQSRSGPPSQPWLEPDILDHLATLAADGVKDVVVSPIGFVSDHMEVLYDLDEEAAKLASQLGMNFVRAGTAGTHPAMIAMFKELIEAPVIVCHEGCCPAPRRG
jgi:protoporphyrin/coproporphyrin ferrochelatase